MADPTGKSVYATRARVPDSRGLPGEIPARSEARFRAEIIRQLSDIRSIIEGIPSYVIEDVTFGTLENRVSVLEAQVSVLIVRANGAEARLDALEAFLSVPVFLDYITYSITGQDLGVTTP